MKISIIVPTSDCRRSLLYRLGNMVYGPSSAITGPLILGGILKRAGHEVEVYQEFDWGFDISRINDSDLVGIYTMSSNSRRAYELADYARDLLGKRVIIGGIHASALPDEALQHADQVITGEAESVILDVVEGRITSGIVRAPVIHDLDTIPFPDYSTLKTSCNAANILTTRGCPYRCSFCTTSRMFLPYRERSVDNVIEEIRQYKIAGFKYLNFQDDNLTANRERTRQILSRMISENLVFKESFFFGRIDFAQDEELLELLRDAHLRRVLIGFESLNQKAHDSINKKLNVDDIHKFSDKLSRYKIKIIASIVLGLDTDTKEDIRKAVEHCISITSFQLQPAILTPFPGTELYDRLQSQNRIIEKDWQYYDMMNVVYMPKHMTPAELQKEFFDSLKRFYSFSSVFKISGVYGFNAGLRRFVMWIIFSAGWFYYNIKSRIRNGNIYNQQREYDSFESELNFPADAK